MKPGGAAGIKLMTDLLLQAAASGLLNSWKCCLGLGAGRRLGLFPDNAQAVGGDPLVLLLDQPLFATGAEQMVETLLGLEQLGLLDAQHSTDLAVAIQTLLVGARQAHKTDYRQHAKSQFQTEADAAADQFLSRGRGAQA